MATMLDVNQISKDVYDPETSSYRMVTAATDTITLLNAIPAQTNAISSAVKIGAFKVTGIVVSWTGLTATDATIQFQGSVDGDPAHFDNIGAAVTLGSTAGHQSFSLIDEPYQYFHIVYTHGSNTAGTVTASYFLRA
ncbi:MAG: hypothetical protein H0X31_01030 [Nostocaceae cyanobacterium]|nr:hypothetical protein [Nostocaceae cyanobacterium]